ncbi:MAG: tagaturonate reductase [Cyclobacteriaceae bacterium]
MLKKLNRTTADKPQKYPVRILQFGEGNFLRAFADWMIDIANEKTGFSGAVQIVQPIAQGSGQKLNEQDGLYHVVLNGIRNGKPVKEIRLITCVEGVINPFEDYAAYLKAGENPDLEFVISNTTEAGITFNANDSDPNALAESFPAKLTALLYHRYIFFKGDSSKALTVMPCELIEKNGETLRNIILQYISHWNLGESFEAWITRHTLFCNTLVDRIVPGFPKDTAMEIWNETGYEDNLVVTGEPFHLWVIEPKLTSEMSLEALRQSFPAEKAGLQVKFVEDLAPYRTRKVRILNGAHTAMVPVGYLRNLRTVREVIEDPFTGDFIRKTLEEEIIPTLDLSKEELQQFADDVIERFKNPFIRHELMSIALNSISKYQVRVLPSVLEYIKRTGKLPERLLYSLAALILFYKGEWNGEVIPLNDTSPVLAFFKKAWSLEVPGAVIEQVLTNQELWNIDLTSIKGLTAEVEKQLKGIQELKNDRVTP